MKVHPFGPSPLRKRPLGAMLTLVTQDVAADNGNDSDCGGGGATAAATTTETATAAAAAVAVVVVATAWSRMAPAAAPSRAMRPQAA